jgi:4-amino-4-deoxy-L-arabinose transferase-like glycosyltransferase
MDDPDNYLPLARAVAEGRGLALEGRPTAYRPPLYPLVLAPLVVLMGDRPWWGIRVLHLALGAATVALTARAARGGGLTPGRALVAAAIVALDPVLVVQGRAVMTETLRPSCWRRPWRPSPSGAAPGGEPQPSGG